MRNEFAGSVVAAGTLIAFDDLPLDWWSLRETLPFRSIAHAREHFVPAAPSPTMPAASVTVSAAKQFIDQHYSEKTVRFVQRISSQTPIPRTLKTFATENLFGSADVFYNAALVNGGRPIATATRRISMQASRFYVVRSLRSSDASPAA